MKIREATQKMLRNIEINRHIAYSVDGTTKRFCKDIAEQLGITKSAFSRLYTGAATPNVETFIKIVRLHKIEKGDRSTAEILDEICV